MACLQPQRSRVDGLTVGSVARAVKGLTSRGPKATPGIRSDLGTSTRPAPNTASWHEPCSSLRSQPQTRRDLQPTTV
jgi:hypothetical protein